MQITQNDLTTIETSLSSTSPIMLNDIQETLEINKTYYQDGSTFSLENGYGFQIYLVMNLQEYVELALNIDLFKTCFLETEDKIYEEVLSYNEN